MSETPISSKSSQKSRLDLLLINKGLCPTRTKAQALILAGQVQVEGECITKVGTLINNEASVGILMLFPYVSRGGEKLKGALTDFNLSPEGHVCMDVGSSTGGFTDCLLQQGARMVYAIDVGRGQLHQKMRTDNRVRVHEKTHILHVENSLFDEKPTFVTVDVSFISLKKVLLHIRSLLPSPTTIVALLKPQFEVGPQYLKKGVVQSEAIRQKAVDDMVSFLKENKITVKSTARSRLKGPKGNQEIFLHIEI